MTARDSNGRFARTQTALAVRTPWIDGLHADWLITSARAAWSPPRFDWAVPKSADRTYLAGIDVVNAALGMELDEQVRQAREDIHCIHLDWHRRHVNGIRRAELPPAPEMLALDEGTEAHMAAIEAAWDDEGEK